MSTTHSERPEGIEVLPPGQECGEVCPRPAAVELDGSYVYCWHCLARLVRLGVVFEASIAQARHEGLQP